MPTPFAQPHTPTQLPTVSTTPAVKSTPQPVSRPMTVVCVTARTGTMLPTMPQTPQSSEPAATPPLTPLPVPLKLPTVNNPCASSQLVMLIPRVVPNAQLATREELPPLPMLTVKPLVSPIAL